MSGRALHLVALGGAAVAAGCCVFYFSFTVDDAWITQRYVNNFLEHGEWAFNLGEPVNALTSTVHFLTLVVLQWLTGNALVANKVVMGGLIVASAGVLAARFAWKPVAVAVVATLILASPFLWLWAMGGLETMLLMFLLTAFVTLALRADEDGPFLVFNVLSGLAFLTRYDAIVFVFPVLVAIWWKRYAREGASRVLLLGLASSAVLPLAWFVFSLWSFHDIFPTSFYAKRSRTVSLYRVEYTLQFMLLSGALVFLAGAVLALYRQGRANLLRAYARKRLPIFAGLILLSAYASAHSTVHMMFGYRLFLPYLPVFVLLVIEILDLGTETPDSQGSGSSAPLLAGGLALCLGFQVAQAVVVYDRGLAGIGWSGEYRSQSVKTYQSGFVWAMTQGCADIRRHASGRPEFSTRAPRFRTFAEGYIPFCYPELYVYGQLISMRRPPTISYARSGDYVYVLYPRLGPIQDQLGRSPDTFERLSSYEVEFDGATEEFIIFFNPAPDNVALPPYIR